MPTLSGSLQTFDLTPGMDRGRRYIQTSVTYNLFREYCRADVYNPFNKDGEQREPRVKNINRFINEYYNGNYTPTVFNVVVTEPTLITQTDNVISIALNENYPLIVLDGHTRWKALEKIRSSGEVDNRRVDQLPIPLIVYLQDFRKRDFVNLNYGTPVDKSHLLSLNIDNGYLPGDRLELLSDAQSLAKYLHVMPGNPLSGLISFGSTPGGSVAFNVIASTRKGCLSHSLCGASKILRSAERDHGWYVKLMTYLYEAATEGGQTAEGYLLCLPPKGPKGAASLLVGCTNILAYYLYLNETDKIRDIDWDILKDALMTFSDSVGGTLTTYRAQTLMCEFAQQMFLGYAKRYEEKCYAGIPRRLIVTVGASSLGLSMNMEEMQAVPVVVTPVNFVKCDTDTDPAFLEG